MHNTNILPILGYGTYWRPIATNIKPPTKCMKFEGSPNDVVVIITKMTIITGKIVIRFWHQHILGVKKKNRGECAYVSNQYNGRNKRAK